jgi:hypothetical protein
MVTRPDSIPERRSRRSVRTTGVESPAASFWARKRSPGRRPPFRGKPREFHGRRHLIHSGRAWRLRTGASSQRVRSPAPTFSVAISGSLGPIFENGARGQGFAPPRPEPACPGPLRAVLKARSKIRETGLSGTGHRTFLFCWNRTFLLAATRPLLLLDTKSGADID